jgi:hypothetical protein
LKSTFFWDVSRVVWWEFTEVSEELTASIFRVEEQSKHPARIMQQTKLCFTSQKIVFFIMIAGVQRFHTFDQKRLELPP